jgi:ribosomal protein S18 acetylase RimI-like enzyme
MVVAYEGEDVAGMAYGHVLPRPDGAPPKALLYSIDVLEEHRRKGVGAALVRAFREAAPGPLWVVTNASNEAAMRLYAATGGVRPHEDDVVFVYPA